MSFKMVAPSRHCFHPNCSPCFTSGVTKAEDWSVIRQAPAPWAEFEFDNIILTLPSNNIRNLDFPLEMEKIWNDIMKGIADLAAIPHKFIRKERIVTDVQISAGKRISFFFFTFLRIFNKIK